MAWYLVVLVIAYVAVAALNFFRTIGWTVNWPIWGENIDTSDETAVAVMCFMLSLFLMWLWPLLFLFKKYRTEPLWLAARAN